MPIVAALASNAASRRDEWVWFVWSMLDLRRVPVSGLLRAYPVPPFAGHDNVN